MDDIIKVLILKDGRYIVTKIKEVPDHEIGEPDCVMIDPVLLDPNEEDLTEAMTRFPGREITDDTKMAISSDNILSMVSPTNTLLSEYLVAISD